MNLKQLRFPRRKGVIVPLSTVIFSVLFVIAAMVINLAYVQYVKTELDVATDAAARAAGRILSTTGDTAAAMQAARDVIKENLVGGKEMVLLDTDFEFGEAERLSITNRYDFVESSDLINAVKIKTDRRVGSSNGAIQLYFPNMLGREEISISSDAIGTRIELDICLVLDRSGSMAYADNEVAQYPPVPAAAPENWYFGDQAPPQSRWLDVRDATEVFLEQLTKSSQTERIALCTYSDLAATDVDCTTNYSDIMDELDLTTAEGATNINAGLLQGSNAIIGNGSRDYAAKVIVLMTDGVRTTGGWPVTTAEELFKDGTIVFTVTFSDEADQWLMKEVAAKGGGKHFHAQTREELIEIFNTIASHLPTLLVE